MVSYKNNRGMIFKNRPEENKPSNYSGTINVDGVLYFIDLYINQGPKEKYFGVSLSKKEKQFTKPEEKGDDFDVL